MQGMIALDIDGTLTAGSCAINPRVVSFLESLTLKGWVLVFITGRTFSWGYQLLSALSFPYFFAAYNGAFVFQGPQPKVITQTYLEPSLLPALDVICQQVASDYVIYTDMQGKSVCYYRPDRLPQIILTYLAERRNRSQEEWIALKSYSSLPVKMFPAVKCFGSLSSNETIAKAISGVLPVHAPVIRDPFNTDFSVLQLTHATVSKGLTVKKLASYLGWQGVIVAAGDDHNDISMFEIADVCIVMATAPASVLAFADIVAPAASEEGIIKGLTEAVRRYSP